MEHNLLLKDYVMIIRKYSLLFVLIILGCGALGMFITYMIPNSFTSSIQIYVNHKIAVDNKAFYNYDGYYSTQASVQYTETVSGYLQSLSVIKDASSKVEKDEAYINGGFIPSNLSNNPDFLAAYRKNINVKIDAPQIITVAVTDKDATVSGLWAKYLGTEVTDNLSALNKVGDYNFVIDTIHDPITQTNRLNPILDGAVGIIVGIFIAFSTGFLLEAYKKPTYK